MVDAFPEMLYFVCIRILLTCIQDLLIYIRGIILNEQPRRLIEEQYQKYHIL